MKNGNTQKNWDVIVIGGGVIGCAVHRKFALMGAKTLLLEKGGDILSGAGKANNEPVTKREIKAAFDSNVPPECLGGLRRRTRAMMDRCNGF